MAYMAFVSHIMQTMIIEKIDPLQPSNPHGNHIKKRDAREMTGADQSQESAVSCAEICMFVY